MNTPADLAPERRLERRSRPPDERVQDYREVSGDPAREDVEREATRCQDCGTPFCHALGCPLGNLIPEYNEAVGHGNWYEAWRRLELTHDFPEITGRVCPALCEAACCRAVNQSPVALREIERAIAEHAWRSGWIVPRRPPGESGRRVAVVGSGPAGLAAARRLRGQGHKVSLFEKEEKIGGILRYGIPDFKLEKWVLDRRIEQMAAEGIEFETGLVIGEDLSVRYLRRKYDALLLALGAGEPRDLPVPGRGYEGIAFAMDYLTASNRAVAGEPGGSSATCATSGDYAGAISARDKRVLVIGGGDTGADCVGTALRQGARSVTQTEIMPRPRDWRELRNPDWPFWPQLLRTSSSHEEGCERLWATTVSGFSGGYDPRVQKARLARVQWRDNGSGERRPVEIPDSGFELDVDLVLLALGFLHVKQGRLLEDLNVALDARGNIAVDESYATTVPGIFAAGDCHGGPSLVVQAINHGRQAAAALNDYLRLHRDRPGLQEGGG
jgi:glutamate synthase (NADPH/NADH) small chain